jgi:hypothetical protein
MDLHGKDDMDVGVDSFLDHPTRMSFDSPAFVTEIHGPSGFCGHCSTPHKETGLLI